MPIRVGVYFDGFNMYHALHALGKPRLKWLDLTSLSRSFLTGDETLERVVMCTAVRTDNVEKMLRHRAYIAALEAKGVECLKGHFADEDGDCRKCGHEWVRPVEKQGDLNVGLAVLDDAHRDLVDKCFLVSADGDQAATARFFRKRFAERGKAIISVAPPGKHHSKIVRDSCDGHRSINAADLDLHLLPQTLQGKDRLILRPTAYDP
jgi:hypothetical protein